MDTKKAIQDNVMRLREERGLKRIELARRAGVPHSIISEVENGNRSLSIESLIKVAKALNIGVEELLTTATPTEE